MNSWLTWMVDGVIAFTLVEGLLLYLYNRQTGKGIAPRDFAANMASGLCLMAALRTTLEGGDSLLVALALFAAGLIHATDLWSRWRRP